MRLRKCRKYDASQEIDASEEIEEIVRALARTFGASHEMAADARQEIGDAPEM